MPPGVQLLCVHLPGPVIALRTERKNGNIFLWANLLVYLSAPVRYIGITQAVLCSKLGASAGLSNLPTSAYAFGCLAPLFVTCFIAHRLERRMVVGTSVIVSVLLALVALALFLPWSNGLRVDLVVGQAILLGFLNSIQQVYLLQCLGRGTTEAGRARALKLTYTFGPLAAVAGSLAAQFVLRGGLPYFAFPRDFALLYFVGVPTSAIMAWCCGRFELEPMAEEAPTPFYVSLAGSFRRFLTSRRLIVLWFAYFCWYSAYWALPNLALYALHAMGRDPASFSGLMMAIQYGSKAFAGFGFGLLYQRHGVRAPMIATILASGFAVVWAWSIPGYGYLGAFALVGAGQLGDIYFRNAVLSWSPAATATRDLSIFSLVVLASSPVPTMYGKIADHWGFPPSFELAIGFAVIGLILLLRLPAKAVPVPVPAGTA
jgi:MFS family permease